MIDPITAIAASIAIAGSGIGAAYAEAHIGAAAEGTIVEKPELFSKAMVLMVIPETIVVFGFVVAMMLIFGV